MLERDAEHALDEAVVGHRDAVADEAGCELGVEDAGGAHAVARREQQQVAGGRVHHELHGWIGHELGDRADVDVLERIDDRDALGARELEQARHRAVRPLPHELGVEREPSLAARGLGEASDLAGTPQVLDRHLAHVQPSTRHVGGNRSGVNLVTAGSVFPRSGFST